MLDYNEYGAEVFGYTDFMQTFYSQIVLAAYYDANTSELLVSLAGSGVYLYHNVPATTWSEFKNAESKGHFYNTVVKRHYGPGTGYLFVGVEPIDDEPAKGTPKGLTYAEDAVVDGERVRLYGVHRRKPAAVAQENNVVLSITNEPKRFRTEVFFEANGTEKSHTLYVHDSNEAVEAVEQIGAMLDVDLNIKRVVVYFE